jgi:hypothetical protein
MVCPILKTREMLYRGGMVATESDDAIVVVDGRMMIYDDAPVILGAGSFREVRGGGDGGDDDVDRLRVIDTLHDLEVRESIRELVVGGYTTVPSRHDIVSRYGGGLMKVEEAARNDLKALTKKRSS